MSNEVLSTSDIDQFFSSFEVYKGTCSSDTIPIKQISHPQAFIINTAENIAPGEHWMGLIIEGKNCWFFNSYGEKIKNHHILNTLKNVGCKSYLYNSIPIQAISSSNCGYFCIAFILSYIRKVPYDMFLNNFSLDTGLNNEICYRLIRKYIS